MRSVARILTVAVRAAPRPALRAGGFAARASALGARPAAGPATPIRALSASAIARANGSVDSDLSHALDEEVEYEAEQAAEEGVPDFIQAFTDKTGFKIKTKLGDNRVAMTKQFGTEHITVVFDVSEIRNIDDPIADISVYRENEQGDAVKEAEAKSEDAPKDFPIFFTATFAKPGAPVLHMELESEECEVGVDHMRFIPEEAMAVGKDMASEWGRKQVYCGPIFGQLSDDLKENVDAFLAERGIDTALTLFMQDYIEFKEQGDYLDWLRKFKTFIDA
ncbi:Mitochondrial acidic protein mam33 [Coemansia biformis]|uniref:Mitochondrial acidic protein mam33 n=1 Tax=Coemansia biformis TaxID=1286918 RepID=A0A9W7YH51_9FUNG|nr:Mitochondrial acidic protein mam33 [Coemansia biformis]